MRLIDADQLRFVEACIEPTFVWDKPHWETIILKDRIDNAPTVDAQPVRHGQWIGISDGDADGFPVYDEWECSCCGVVFEDEEPPYKYCPNCGAKMDGK